MDSQDLHLGLVLEVSRHFPERAWHSSRGCLVRRVEKIDPERLDPVVGEDIPPGRDEIRPGLYLVGIPNHRPDLCYHYSLVILGPQGEIRFTDFYINTLMPDWGQRLVSGLSEALIKFVKKGEDNER